jgi:hypothetical protein
MDAVAEKRVSCQKYNFPVQIQRNSFSGDEGPE